MKVLAIAPITKRFGAVVFEDMELVYFAVATVKSNKISQSLKIKISQTIRNLIGEFEPDLVIVKRLNKQQDKSNNLRLAVEQIKLAAETAHLKSVEVPFEAVKSLFCTDNKPTKTNIFAKLATVYPELRRFLHQPNKWQKEYYEAMLSAIAVGFYYQKEMPEQTQAMIRSKPSQSQKDLFPAY